MIPGGNLLNAAMSVLAKQQMQHLVYIGRDLVEGDYVPKYAVPVTVYGSIQPVKRSLYEHMGLDFQKNYHNIFMARNVADIKRASVGDQFIFGCTTFQVESNEPWFQMDGWDQCLCVEVTKY